MCLPLANSTVAALAYADAHHIEFAAQINDGFSNVNASTYSTLSEDNSSRVTAIACSVVISNDRNRIEGDVYLTTVADTIQVKTSGTVEYFDDAGGYASVMDGLAFIDGAYKHVTIDMLYINENDNFTALTIGRAGKEIPVIYFYGQFSENISSLSEQNVEKTRVEMVAESVATENDYPQMRSTSVDATTRFQSTDTLTSSGYEMVTISLYHANELRNQSTMSVYAKVNSHSAAFKEYMINELGFDAWGSTLIVYPDTYTVEIIGADKYLHTDGVVTPTSNVESYDLTFYAYVPEIGIISFGFPIITSSTSVEFRGIATDPVYNNNIVSWNVYRQYGWNSWDMDGYYDDPEGGVVYARYTYEGNVTSNTRVSIGAYGSVRYEYIYTNIFGSSMTLHLWTDEALCANGLMIIP